MNSTISNIKALGILLMVMGHAIAGLSGIYNIAYNFIYLFHMPLFFFCSGYLFKDKYTETINSSFVFFKKKVKGLYVPYLKWCLLFIAVHDALIALNFYSPLNTPNGVYLTTYQLKDYWHCVSSAMLFNYNSDPMLGGFWFIGQLFWCSLIACGLMWILGKITLLSCNTRYIVGIMICLLMSLVVSFVHKSVPFIGINQRAFLCASYFLTGKLYAHNVGEIKLNIKAGWVILIILLIIATTDVIDDVTQYSPINYQLIPIKYIVALMGIYLSFLIITRPFIVRIGGNWISQIGNLTLVILALHFSSFKIVNLFICGIYNKSITEISSFPIIPYCNALFFVLYMLVGISVPFIIYKIYHLILRRIYGNKV